MNQKIIDQRNSYLLDGDVAILTITRLNGGAYKILIDADAVPRMRKHLWRVACGGRSTQVASGSSVYGDWITLADFVAGKPLAGMLTYYVDCNWQNCMAENLRHGTRGEAVANGKRAAASAKNEQAKGKRAAAARSFASVASSKTSWR